MLSYLKLSFTLVCIWLIFTFTSSAQAPTSTVYLPFVAGTGHQPQAYFQVGFDHNPALTFTILLTDSAKIAQARRSLSQTHPTMMVIGQIITHSVSYNPGWSYHLNPATINLAESAIEVCDGSPDYVEEHLAEAGGAFLPGYYWCPWSSYLKAELPTP